MAGTELTRRESLGVMGGLTTGFLSGYIPIPRERILQTPQSESNFVMSDWRMPKYDSARSSHTSAANPPTNGPVQVGRTITAGDTIVSEPIIRDNIIYLLSENSGSAAIKSIDMSGNSRGWQRDIGAIDTSIFSNLNLYIGNGTVYASTAESVWALDAGSGNERWKSEKRSAGIAVSGDRVYETLTQEPDDDDYKLCRALNAANGAVEWEKEVEITIAGTGPPAVSEGTVYFGGIDGITALSSSDGSREWDYRNNNNEFRGTPPAVSDGVVITGNLVALDSSNGVSLWENVGGDEDVSSRYGIAISNGRFFISPGGNLIGYDLKSGNQLWTMEGTSTGGTPPSVSNGVVYMGGADRVYARSAENGEEHWTLGFENNSKWSHWHLTPVLTGDRILITTTEGAAYFIMESNTKPNAAFSYSPSAPQAGESVQLDASPSSDPNGSIAQYQWNLDQDGSGEKSGEQVSVTFGSAREYEVSLTVRDDDGATSSTVRTINVNPQLTTTTDAETSAETDSKSATDPSRAQNTGTSNPVRDSEGPGANPSTADSTISRMTSAVTTISEGFDESANTRGNDFREEGSDKGGSNETLWIAAGAIVLTLLGGGVAQRVARDTGGDNTRRR